MNFCLYHGQQKDRSKMGQHPTFSSIWYLRGFHWCGPYNSALGKQLGQGREEYLNPRLKRKTEFSGHGGVHL